MPPSQGQYGGMHTGAGRGGIQAGAFLAVVFGLLLAILAWLLLGRAGLTTVMFLLGSSIVAIVVSYLAWNNIGILVGLWIFSMSGFRSYTMIYMPFLPDISVERVFSIWIILLFSLRLLMKRDSIRGPYLLDVLMLLHMMYILANVMYIGDRAKIHEWAISSVTPYLAYVVGKNVVYNDKTMRLVMITLMVVSLYYTIQSVAQKFGLDFLVWPKAILDRQMGLWPEGRSRGPFLHPPLFGQMMSMLMLVQFYFYFRVQTRVIRVAIFAGILLSGLALLFTYTRAPWLAAVIGVATLAILRPRYRQFVTGLAVLITFAGFFGLLQLADSELLRHRFGDTNTIDNRLAVMSAAIRMWLDNPLTGIGFFNWVEVYPQYHRGEYIPFYGYVAREAGRYVVVHDIYWGRLAEEGLISVALLTASVGIIWARIKTLWVQVGEKDWLNRDGLAVVVAIFVAYLIGGLAIDYRYFDMVSAVPYLFAGALYGYQIPEHDPPPPPYAMWTPPYFANKSDQ